MSFKFENNNNAIRFRSRTFAPGDVPIPYTNNVIVSKLIGD